MALATIGESVVSKIIDAILEKASCFLEENLFPDGDTEAELERLRDALPQIKAVLEAVESNQIKIQNKALDAWLWRFRDAVECAEDVLDELAYYDLEEEVQARNVQGSSSFSGYKRKFVNYVSRKCKDDTLTRLVKAVRGLDKAIAGVSNFLNLEKQLRGFWGKKYEDSETENNRETGSLLTESVVFGRDKERDLVIEWLTADPVSGDNSASNTGCLSAFSIIGIGGLGKTTLAQLICKDERVTRFFKPIIWVCVSDYFDASEIITKILEFITGERPTIRSLASLQEILKESLIAKKFLLVLDDVWNDANRPQWENLVAPLKFGHAQSRIVVTSRMESVVDMVAKVFEGAKNYHKLKGLMEKEFLTLFYKHAFAGVDPDEFINLHPIGKEIAKKLGGCPLAAKIMGGVLSYSMELDYWNKVLKEDVPNFLSGMDDIMVVLRLSYYHLPANLQLCFRYCSIFPKNYWFEEDELIRMWMGSGLIEQKQKRYIPEDVGSEYFNHLVTQLPWLPPSAYKLYHLEVIKFKDRRPGTSDGIDKSAIHNLIKLRYVDSLNSFISEIPAIGKLPFLQELNFAVKEERGYQINELGGLRNLRKLCIADLEKVSSFQEAMAARLSEKEYLKDLGLRWSFSNAFSSEEDKKVLDNLRPHVNLAVLAVYKYGGARPPVWMTHQFLVNLMKLNLRDCSRLSTLPALGKLPLLKHLTLDSLTEIKKLDHTFYGNGEGFSFPVLKELIFYRMEEWEEWVDIEDIAVFPRLDTLELHWCPKLRKLPSPPSSLRNLKLYDVGIYVLPRFYQNVRNGILSKPSLLSLLEISCCRNLISLDECLLQQQEHMQALTELHVCDCSELVHFPSRWFIDLRSLRTLTIENCPKLVTSSSTQGNLLPSSLQKISITNCGLETPVLGSLRNLTSLKELSLTECPNLTSLPSADALSALTALSSLLIDECEELVSLGGLDALTSLRCLTITQCDKIVALASSQPLLQTNVGLGVNGRSCSLKLETLDIAHSSLLRLEPLRSLEWTEKLVLAISGNMLPEEWLLRNRSSLQSLTIVDATGLEHLPASMERLQFLEVLHIFDAQLIQSLPDLPLSLYQLLIAGCHPLLKERYKNGGLEWYKIAHIRTVNLS